MKAHEERAEPEAYLCQNGADPHLKLPRRLTPIFTHIRDISERRSFDEGTEELVQHFIVAAYSFDT